MSKFRNRNAKDFTLGDHFFFFSKESIGYVKYDGRFIVVIESLVDYHWNELERIGSNWKHY